MFFQNSFLQIIGSPEFQRFTLDFILKIETFPFPTAVHVSRRQVIERFVIALIVVMIDEGLDLLFQFTWKVVMLQVYNIFQRAVTALYLALRLRMIAGAPNVDHILLLKIFL